MGTLHEDLTCISVRWSDLGESQAPCPHSHLEYLPWWLHHPSMLASYTLTTQRSLTLDSSCCWCHLQRSEIVFWEKCPSVTSYTVFKREFVNWKCRGYNRVNTRVVNAVHTFPNLFVVFLIHANSGIVCELVQKHFLILSNLSFAIILPLNPV